MSSGREHLVLWNDSSSRTHQSESPSTSLCPSALGPGQLLMSLVGGLCQVSGRTVASTIYQNVYPLAAMWKAVLLSRASFFLSR